ncbi:MAG: CDP-alcohol phosphatidyltransferase family protein, partial [Candidatus Omnitrophica bacterium]|nr:CDP-alcohol phosphatidyltransferase family protein [Candidatus Omnitrophota bacterium]
MSLPNRLTLSRILLTLMFVWFLFQPGAGAKIIAVVVFLLASATDFYDGYYAKKYNLVSDFGKMMDPVADKFLVLTAFFVFAVMHMIALWMFVIICAREVAVTLVRLYAMKRG